MEKRRKGLTLVQINENEFYKGLNVIAANLNRIADLQGEELETWKEVESIVGAMTDQPGRDSVYRKEKDYKGVRQPQTFLTSLGSKYRNPNKTPVPLPGLAISWFNKWARKNPVRLRIWGEAESTPLKIVAGHDSLNHRDYALLSLWAFYFRGEGWKRFKRCPHCKLWFVDKTKNKKKTFCSDACKNRFWSRDMREEAGHKTGPNPKIGERRRVK